MIKGSDCEKRASSVTSAFASVIAAVILGIVQAFLYPVLADVENKVDFVMCGVVSYGGALLLCAVFLSSPVAALYSYRQETSGDMKWWMPLGGMAGATGVCLVGLASSLVITSTEGAAGVVLITLSYNMGLLFGGFTTDHFGFLGTPIRRLNIFKGAACILFTAGLLLFSVEGGVLAFNAWVSLSFIGGLCDAFQPCFNWRASKAFHYPLQAAIVNYIGGFSVIACTWMVYAGVRMHLGILIIKPDELSLSWYHFVVPPFIGMLGVTAHFFFAPKIGMAFFAMIAIIVETCTSLIVDTLWETADNPSREFTWYLAFGLVLSIAGALVTAWSKYEDCDKSSSTSRESNLIIRHL